MKHTSLLFLLFCCCTVDLLCWGPEGHRIVAYIAEQKISVKTKAAIRELLADTSLADVANWADDVRDERPNTSNWHFVNIPLNQKTYSAARDCKSDPQRGDCIIAAIERCKKTLTFQLVPADNARSTQTKKQEKAEALKFLVHFVGDLHQPLHCSDNNDRGGNSDSVIFLNGRYTTNLHRVWDSEIVSRSDSSYKRYAQKLFKKAAKGKQNLDPVTWANETHAKAAQVAYTPALKSWRPGKGPVKLDQKYYNTALPVVEQQLLSAGLRLAALLDQLLGQQ